MARRRHHRPGYSGGPGKCSWWVALQQLLYLRRDHSTVSETGGSTAAAVELDSLGSGCGSAAAAADEYLKDTARRDSEPDSAAGVAMRRVDNWQQRPPLVRQREEQQQQAGRGSQRGSVEAESRECLQREIGAEEAVDWWSPAAAGALDFGTETAAETEWLGRGSHRINYNSPANDLERGRKDVKGVPGQGKKERELYLLAPALSDLLLCS